MTAVLTIDEAAEQLRVSRFTISRLIKSGRLKAVRTGSFGGRWLISAKAIDEFMEGDHQHLEGLEGP